MNHPNEKDVHQNCKQERIHKLVGIRTGFDDLTETEYRQNKQHDRKHRNLEELAEHFTVAIGQVHVEPEVLPQEVLGHGRRVHWVNEVSAHQRVHNLLPVPFRLLA